MKQILIFLSWHKDVHVIRVTAHAVYCAAPALHDSDGVRAHFSELSGPLTTIDEMREWLGY